ncbi:MAG: hypothetical protein AAF354_14450, partial [Pseudomonadota bacterium]
MEAGASGDIRITHTDGKLTANGPGEVVSVASGENSNGAGRGNIDVHLTGDIEQLNEGGGVVLTTYYGGYVKLRHYGKITTGPNSLFNPGIQIEAGRSIANANEAAAALQTHSLDIDVIQEGAIYTRALGGNSRGIFAQSKGGNVSVKQTGTITTRNGHTSHGIHAITGLLAGTITIEQEGAISTDAPNSHAIYAQSNAGGDTTITHVGDIDVTSDASNNLIASDGIRVVNNGTGNAKVTTTKRSGVSDKVYSKFGAGIRVELDNGNADLEIANEVTGGNGTAVDLTQVNGNSRVELQEGFEFTGNVLAGAGTDTLAFGGTGSDTFDLDLIDTGVGTRQFRNFERFTLESGNWSFSGTTSLGFTVNGGTLGGNGTFGGLTLIGGVLAPGDSIGTITVEEALELRSGALFEVEVDAAGNSDQVIVGGTVNLTGAALRVLAENGNYATRTDYTIVENNGTDAVSGSFGQVSVNSAFLTPSVDYAAGDGNDVVLTLEAVPFTTAVTGGGSSGSIPSGPGTRNQFAVAQALDQFPADNALFGALFRLTSFAEARQAFDALSGEVHATVAGTLIDDSRYPREAVMGRMMQAGHKGGALGNGGPQVAHQYDDQAMRLGEAYDGKSLVE